MRRFLKPIFILYSLVYFSLSYASNSVLGEWTTIDDKTGQKRAVVELSIKDDVLSGVIKKVYRQKGDTGLCSKCKGQFKDKPIQGLEFVWGLKPDGQGNWTGGQILDAKTGKIYNVKLSQKGDKLYVRGFVGISLLGRTQIWVR